LSVVSATWIGVQRASDGRVQLRPFGTFGTLQKGATVQIGNQSLKVGAGGRVMVPAAVVRQVGILGKDGLRRIQAEFSARGGPEGWANVGAHLYAPREGLANATAGKVDPKEDFGWYDPEMDISPDDEEGWNWDT